MQQVIPSRVTTDRDKEKTFYSFYYACPQVFEEVVLHLPKLLEGDQYFNEIHIVGSGAEYTEAVEYKSSAKGLVVFPDSRFTEYSVFCNVRHISEPYTLHNISRLNAILKQRFPWLTADTMEKFGYTIYGSKSKDVLCEAILSAGPHYTYIHCRDCPNLFISAEQSNEELIGVLTTLFNGVYYV